MGVDGSILAATNAGMLHALDPATGRDRWTFDGHEAYGSDLSTSAAVLTDGTILWPGPHDTLYALTRMGALLWRQQLSGQVLSPAVAGSNRVYVADQSGHLSAFEITPGAHRLVWTVDVGGTDYSSPSVGPDGTIYTGADHDLVAVRDLGQSAAVRWRFDAEQVVEVSNGVAPDGTVVLGTNNGREYGVRPDGAVAWSFPIGDNTYSSAVVRPDGTAYFGDNSGRLREINQAGSVTHEIVPLGPKKESIWTSAVVDAAGNAYWGSTSANVYGYDSGGKQLFTISVDGSVDSYPALGSDGTLYVGTVAGTLYAIG
ncbi:MAG: PQQ-binding-like beta-propeller repeat protein [Actinomycetota bacterium]|nr:PQQ-binding-like beta-propeller repeat protein [Actinomycetota bacterium]